MTFNVLAILNGCVCANENAKNKMKSKKKKKNKENQHNQNLFNLSVIVRIQCIHMHSHLVCVLSPARLLCATIDVENATSEFRHHSNYYYFRTSWALGNGIDVSCRPLRLHKSFSCYYFKPKLNWNKSKKSNAREEYFMHKTYFNCTYFEVHIQQECFVKDNDSQFPIQIQTVFSMPTTITWYHLDVIRYLLFFL